MTRMKATLQWKGTEACCDITCSCGRYYHYDGSFMSQVKCGCGLVWELSPEISASVAKPSDVFMPIDLEEKAIRD